MKYLLEQRYLIIRHEAMKDYREILGKDKTSSIRQLLGITETKKISAKH